MTTSGAAVPGWYPDPYNPALLRYWDGQTWSAQTAPAAPHNDIGTAPGGGLGDIGDWLSDTFKMIIDRVVPVTILSVVVPAVGYMLLGLIALSAFQGIVYDPVFDEFRGFEPSRLLVLIPIGIVFLIAYLVSWLGLHHQLYWAHRGVPAPIGRSLAAGLRRTPRAIGWGLLLGLGAAVIFGLLLGIPIALAIAADSAGFLALMLLLIPVAMVALVWLGIKLYHFMVAVAVAPSGTSPISTSFDLVRGRWWGTFGRWLLLAIIVWLISVAFQLATSVAGAALPFTSIETDPITNDVIIDGERVSDTEPFEFDDVLPGSAAVVLISVLSAVSQGVTQAIGVSGAAGLYRRAGGPADAAP